MSGDARATDPAGARQLLQAAGLAEPEAMLQGYLTQQRWFSGREREVAALTVEDAGLAEGEPRLLPVLLRVEYGDGGVERYHLPLVVRTAEGELPGNGLVAEGVRDAAPVHVVDALLDRGGAARFWGLLGGDPLPTLVGELAGAIEDPAAADSADDIHTLPRDQSNTMLVRGETQLLKCFRKLDDTSSPEFEMLDALKAAGFAHIPTPMGRIEYRRPGAEPVVMAMLQPFLHNATDGWAIAITSLRDLYAAADESDADDEAAIRDLVDEQGSDFTPDAARLGTVIAEMHLALAGDAIPDAMRAQPAGAAELSAWADEMLADLASMEGSGDHQVPVASLRARIQAMRGLGQAGLAIRVHGDLHLGQTARTDDGWIVLDFEGEPSRTVAARRRRASALRDVAGVMRSLDYAAAVALMDWTTSADPRWERLRRFGDTWTLVNQEAFWDAYIAALGGSSVLPPGERVPALLDAYMVQKALYELRYELNHRPQWAWIPMRYLERPPA
jgi:maltokinase